MKYLIIFLYCLFSFNLFADDTENRFEEELKYLEQEALTTDEVKISNSAIQKQQSPVEVKENKQETNIDNNEETLFFKFKEVRPRRIRSR